MTTTSNIIRLDPPFLLETPLGQAYAHFLQEYSSESLTYFGCFQQETGEFWWWDNTMIRLSTNITMEHTRNSPIQQVAGLEAHKSRYNSLNFVRK